MLCILRVISAMGNCLVKPDALVNNFPAIFPAAKGLYNSQQSWGNNFKPRQRYGSHISSSLDFNGRTFSSHKDSSAPWPCPVIYSQMGHESAVDNQQSYTLAHLLAKSFVENGNSPKELNPILLSSLRKSCSKSTGMGFVHECMEDPVHSKAESPRSKFAGLNLLKFLSSVRRSRSRSRSKSTSNANIIAGDEVSKTHMPKESPSLSTVLGHINIEKNDCSGRVEETDATAKFEECQSDSSDILSSCLPVEDQKAFGSPVSVEGNKLCEKTREWSSFDEFSDSSSDLFDIDFRKPYKKQTI